MAPVEYDILEDRATITIHNPELRNALTLETAQALTEAIDDIEDSDVRCVILQGSEGTFCAGGDIELMMEGLTSDRDTRELMEEAAMPINKTVQRVYECSLPTIAKVDGPAFGAGASLAIACDVVLASERAEISFGFRRVGLSVDSGTSYLLPRMVGENTAKDLVYSGDLLDADEANDLGLFNRVYPADEFEQRAHEYIDTVATGPTEGLKRSKQLLQRGHDRSFDEVIEAEVESIAHIFETDDFEEGVEAFLEQRTPEFEGQ
jgi:enoyl-CoA hydratase/carnithine racemase